jgi:membrane protein DedA with SNARE-associated domain
VVIGAIATVALVVDLVWHEMGRRRGAGVLKRLCRFALEPDLCVRHTENLFLRYGARALLVAKFVPGLTTVMPPLAGIFAVSRPRFLAYDLAGVLLWSGAWAAIGYAFRDAIEEVILRVSSLGRATGLVAVGILGGYVGLKYLRRWLFLRRLRIARISPAALKQKLDDGEAPFITVEALDQRLAEIPRDRELIVYCS